MSKTASRCQTTPQATPRCRRRTFPAAFKRKVILRAEASNNSVAARESGIYKKCVRYWRKQRELLFACENDHQTLRGPVEGKFTKVEEEVKTFATELEARSLAVTVEALQMKARAIAARDGIPHKEFSASRAWVTRFVRRSGLCLHRRTGIRQHLADKCEERLRLKAQDIALAAEIPQASSDDQEHGPGFSKEGDLGAVVGACAACGYSLTPLAIPGIGTQTEMKQEATQTAAHTSSRGTQTCNE